ncbi:MAG: hypothetical protein V9F02_11210, partial [Chitinophagaceae bacterium]
QNQFAYPMQHSIFLHLMAVAFGRAQVLQAGGLFTPSAAGIGNHTVTYTATNAGCTKSSQLSGTSI